MIILLKCISLLKRLKNKDSIGRAKNNKAPDIDTITNELLKNCGDDLIWSINFDIWGQIYPRSTVHQMFYHINYDGPAHSSKCLDIA